MPRKRKMYVVGRDSDTSSLTGVRYLDDVTWMYAVSLRKAQELITHPRQTWGDTIYKLVPVRTKKEK